MRRLHALLATSLALLTLASIGKIPANPAFIRGVLINGTGPAGVFRINRLECEDDCYLKVHGRPEGYEVGFRACNAQVVPTWGRGLRVADRPHRQGLPRPALSPGILPRATVGIVVTIGCRLVRSRRQ